MPKQNFSTTWLALTYNCNNKCNWCYANSNNLTQKQIFPQRYENGTINLLTSLGIKRTILIGGEPTLYPNIHGIIEKITNYEISVGLVSNGRKLKDYFFAKELKENGLKAMSISFGSYSGKIQDKITKIVGSFDEAIGGLENALSVGLKVSSNTVINKNNVEDLEKIVNLLGKRVDIMTWNFCGTCLSEDSNNKSVLSPKETAKAIQRIYNYTKKRNVKIKVVTPMPFCVFDNDYLEIFKKNDIISGGPCQLAHGKNFVIEYNGNIIPCTHFNGFPMMNIFEKEKVISAEDFIGKYFNSEGTPFKFRKMVSKFPSEKCEDENCKEPCSGGCPLIWRLFKPEEVIKKYE
ncbi:MAG: radical SAM protein [Candidatus Nanoarchaeia archaeon]|nr:radical SAM protein [Candidatus Nanoarchaeia archaeon]MDD5357681.1 radical SAM protein [Candidatus Nanoarchaeia archaeon]MDD5588600.1 radical SAM protein [Candidatus Nanoarchaeia archaeon]